MSDSYQSWTLPQKARRARELYEEMEKLRDDLDNVLISGGACQGHNYEDRIWNLEARAFREIPVSAVFGGKAAKESAS